MADRQYRIKTPEVVSENIDGEVIIIHLKYGYYYSLDTVGAQLWGWLEEGESHDTIQQRMVEMYTGDEAHIRQATADFLCRLRAEELITATTEVPASPRPACPSALSARGSQFMAPVLHRYTDMSDLLLLDPIHDVDEVGWPTPREL